MITLLKVRVPHSDIRLSTRQEFVEAGRATLVEYDSLEIVTAHGLKLMASDLGMEKALDQLQENAEHGGWASVVETPPELFSETDCAGLVVRPYFFDYEICVWFMRRHGAALIQHFGHGACFTFMPELHEVSEVRVDL